MDEYIEREAVKKKLGDLHFPNYGYALIAVNEIPAADVVEVDVVKRWLYKIAINNVNVKFDGDFSKACEEIISRLDGLRNFAKEVNKTDV